MSHMFWKKRPPQPQALAVELDKRFQDLNNRFSRIEQSLEQLRTNTTQITIENVHIHQPVVEKMEYRLDNLDIEQLSGSLNLGNNFGAKITPDSSSLQADIRRRTDSAAPSEQRQSPHKANPSSQMSDPPLSGLQRTQTGYRVTKS